jgi:hypothetical protein
MRCQTEPSTDSYMSGREELLKEMGTKINKAKRRSQNLPAPSSYYNILISTYDMIFNIMKKVTF